MKYKFEGESIDKRDFLITPHSYLRQRGELMILDYKGKLKKKVELPCFAMDFKLLNYNDGYTYNLCEKNLKKSNGWYELSKVILADKDLNPYKEIMLKPYGSGLQEEYVQCHDNLILSDNHYFLMGTILKFVKINGKRAFVVDCIIQEQLNDQVVWQFETTDYDELYKLSNWHNDYFNKFDLFKGTATDYAHMNSMALTSDGKYLYISLRNIGILKVEYDSKKILWILGDLRCDLKYDNLITMPKWQHDIRLLDDNTFTIFDNSGSNKCSRVLKIQVIGDTITLYKELNTIHDPSRAMGGAIEISEGVYDICYGAFRKDEVLEEYDFNTNKQLMKFDFANKHFMYRIERGKKDDN